jgi:hypothetical protein
VYNALLNTWTVSIGSEMKELKLRPYPGRLFVTTTKEDYESAHKKLFKTPDVLTCKTAGRYVGGEGHDGLWTYLVFAPSPPILAHELSHVLFTVFEFCEIDVRDSGGEAFCYMLGQLMSEVPLMHNGKETK